VDPSETKAQGGEVATETEEDDGAGVDVAEEG